MDQKHDCENCGSPMAQADGLYCCAADDCTEYDSDGDIRAIGRPSWFTVDTDGGPEKFHS